MVQIQLQPETEARYAAEAQGRGITLEQYLAEKLEAEVAEEPRQAEDIAIELAKLEVFFKEFAKYSDKIPILPDEALTREGIYGDPLSGLTIRPRYKRVDKTRATR